MQENREYKPFEMGQTVATAGILDHVPYERVIQCLRFHAAGDWGNVGPDDWVENNISSRQGLRIFSSYPIVPGDDGANLWVITEGDRSSTTVLLPEEY